MLEVQSSIPTLRSGQASKVQSPNLVLVVLCLIWVVTGTMYAANPDAIEIWATPAVSYSVSISTNGAALDFGNVNLNTTYVLSSSATVTNNGNATADWKIQSQSLTEWTLAATPGSNTARLCVVLNSTAPVSGDFSTTNDPLSVTETNMNGTNFAGNQNGNDVAVSGQKLLWFRLDTPTDTSYTTQQKFRVIIKAYVSSTF